MPLEKKKIYKQQSILCANMAKITYIDFTLWEVSCQWPQASQKTFPLKETFKDVNCSSMTPCFFRVQLEHLLKTIKVLIGIVNLVVLIKSINYL